MLAYFLYALLLIPVGVMWRGYVLSIMWGWFIVSTFALPMLTVPQAVGVAAMISAFTYSESSTKDDGEGKSAFVLMVAATLKVFLIPLGFLTFGAIVKQFI